MSSSPPASVPVVLGLGLGGGAAGAQVGKPPPPPASAPTTGTSFTFMQLQELQQQALIYKYMSSGLPVPLHLVLPIWKSVAGSGAGAGAAYYPAFMMGFKFDVGLLGGFDYKNLLEPEPGRCRRTDGKKWRCSRDVVPDHKYCDKHLHRGRNRSRKHVEQQEAAAAAVTPTDAAATAVNRNNSNSNSNVINGGKASMVTLAGSEKTPALSINDGNGRRNNSAPSLSPAMGVPPTSLQLMPPTPHCSRTTNTATAITSSVPVYGGGGGIHSLATLRSYSNGNNNSTLNNAPNLFHSAIPPQQMFGFSPTSVLLGGRTTSGIPYS